jgi:transposase, IS30 family
MARHLTKEERDRIAQLHHRGFLQNQIAEALGRNPGTISRELNRNRVGGEYFAAQAHDLAQQRRRERPLARKLDDPEINAAVRRGLAQQWSPEQIEGAQKRAHPDEPDRHVSARTIYTWIEQDEHRDHWKSFLRRRGKRPYRRKNTTNSCLAARIKNRPEVIEQRLRLGDFEGDTVLGPPGTGGLVTLVCRRSRLTIITKIQSKDADHVHQRIKQRLKELAEERCHSITFDNGTEFARCQRLERHLDMQLYFADPGCPYQRGTNENTNGLIRQYFPKGTDFRTVSHCEVRQVENMLNNRPRECLDFETPATVFHKETPPSACD